jgi:hypothetical protein
MPDARRLFSASSFVIAMIACAGTALSACVSPRERQAYEVYALRTDVLVGAQSCRMTDRFNVFATKFTRELTAEGRALRAFYQKTYGKGGDTRLDDFVTQLANSSVVEGNRGGGNLCAMTTALFDDVMAVPVGQLAVFSHTHHARALPAMDVCGIPSDATKKKKV